MVVTTLRLRRLANSDEAMVHHQAILVQVPDFLLTVHHLLLDILDRLVMAFPKVQVAFRNSLKVLSVHSAKVHLVKAHRVRDLHHHNNHLYRNLRLLRNKLLSYRLRNRPKQMAIKSPYIYSQLLRLLA